MFSKLRVHDSTSLPEKAEIPPGMYSINACDEAKAAKAGPWEPGGLDDVDERRQSLLRSSGGSAGAPRCAHGVHSLASERGTQFFRSANASPKYSPLPIPLRRRFPLEARGVVLCQENGSSCEALEATRGTLGECASARAALAGKPACSLQQPRGS